MEPSFGKAGVGGSAALHAARIEVEKPASVAWVGGPSMDTQLSLFSDLPAGRSFDEPPLPGFTDLAPELADEAAAVWGLPVGKVARVMLRGHAVDELSGLVQIAGLPELPLDARKVLRLRIGREEFTNRQVTGWSLAG